MTDLDATANTPASSTDTSAQLSTDWRMRYGLWLVALAPLIPQAIGTLFNIAYNVIHVDSLLVGDQAAILQASILRANLVIYPVAFGSWAWTVASVRRPFQAALNHQPIPRETLEWACRRVINFPWWVFAFCGCAWLAIIPAILIPLHASSEPVAVQVNWHMSASVVIGGLIGVTHAFFAVEMASQRFVFPALFRDIRPAQVSGTYPLTLQQRGVMWSVSSVFCPVACLWLLVAAPDSTSRNSLWFAAFTAAFAVALGLSTSWMLGRLVTKPIEALRKSARDVASGNLDTSVDLVRSDEFGPLIDEFNNMVADLRAKQAIQAAFGRHVGREAAQQILEQDPNLRGASREITVLFADVRNFTARCSVLSAEEVVRMLNLLFTEMVDVIEQQHGGMVNKFLGDGLMALFGAGNPRDDHADAAVAAAREMLDRLQLVNQRLVDLGFDPMAIGIGIHTGQAVVGSIGSTGRSDYTAIGNTVNVASRVESLTKALDTPVLITEQSFAATMAKPAVATYPPQEVKGKSEPLIVFGLRSGEAE